MYEDKHILIVDDLPMMRSLMRDQLRRIGFKHVVEAECGQSAIRRMEHRKFDLVIADWNMPEMDGLELLKVIRAADDWKDTPFVMVTAEAKRAKVIEAVEAGVDNYIVKPFSASTLEEKIQKVFK